MEAFDLRTIHKYTDGWDLVSDTLLEHERLLWELEYLAKESQPEGNSDINNKLNLVKAQILLFERLLIGERIESLIALSHHYADILSQPRLQVT
jgi:hypothetical protein